MTCPAKHTKYQPTNDEFKCPKCEKGPKENGLVVDDGDEEADDLCTELHENDELVCYACRYVTSGKRFAALLQRRNNMVTCPHCKGKGLVPGTGSRTDDDVKLKAKLKIARKKCDDAQSSHKSFVGSMNVISANMRAEIEILKNKVLQYDSMKMKLTNARVEVEAWKTAVGAHEGETPEEVGKRLDRLDTERMTKGSVA